MIIFGVTGFYFAASLVRLTLILAPVMSTLAAITVVELGKPAMDIIQQAVIFPRRKLRFTSRVSREFSLGRLIVPVRAERPFKLRLSVSIRNLLNTNNPGTPIGNLASPLFGLSNSMAYSSGADRQAGNNRSFAFQAVFIF